MSKADGAGPGCSKSLLRNSHVKVLTWVRKTLHRLSHSEALVLVQHIGREVGGLSQREHHDISALQRPHMVGVRHANTLLHGNAGQVA